MATPDSTDAEIVSEARRLQAEMRLGPVVYVALVGGPDDARPDRAEVRFNGQAPGPQITVKRYHSHLGN